MKIVRTAQAGTLESSDISVTVYPGGDGVQISLVSSVQNQFGDSICALLREVAEELGVTNAEIEAVDHGALACTIRARLETALKRAAKEEQT